MLPAKQTSSSECAKNIQKYLSYLQKNTGFFQKYKNSLFNLLNKRDLYRLRKGENRYQRRGKLDEGKPSVLARLFVLNKADVAG